jgi:LAO/AO transport system kinase
MSSRTGEGISEVWQTLCDYKNIITDTGELKRRRADQRKNWMWAYIQSHLLVVN